MSLRTVRLFALLGCVMLLITTTSSSFAESRPILADNFDNGYGNWDSSKKFGGTISLVVHGDGKAVRVNRSNIQGNNFTRLSYKMPPHVVKGQHVMLQGMVKAEDIAPGKEHFHGGRIDFEIMTPAGVHHAGCELIFTGSFDWTMHSFECDVPADASAISRQGRPLNYQIPSPAKVPPMLSLFVSVFDCTSQTWKENFVDRNLRKRIILTPTDSTR